MIMLQLWELQKKTLKKYLRAKKNVFGQKTCKNFIPSLSKEETKYMILKHLPLFKEWEKFY